MTTTQPSLFTSRRVHGTARLTEYGVAAPVGGVATPGRTPTKYARAMARAFIDHQGILDTGWHLERTADGRLRYAACSNQPHKGPYYLHHDHGVAIGRASLGTTSTGARLFRYRVSRDQWETLARIAGRQ